LLGDVFVECEDLLYYFVVVIGCGVEYVWVVVVDDCHVVLVFVFGGFG